jgi:GDPmannose 4,6-dehydratase
MKSALILGITSQDGLYLSELLLERGYRVVGAVRDMQSAKTKLPEHLVNSIELAECDMLDQKKIVGLFARYCPDEVYNFAAFSLGTGMYDNPVEIGDVNGLAVVRILEAIRIVNRNIRFGQASSREIFGEPVESPQTEITRANPRSPYGAAKLYADNMIRIYRQRYGLFACSAILYNHESPRRGVAFVTRKITYAAARIKLGLANELKLGNIDAQRDWGFAGDTVRAIWLMLQHSKADDYVVATGETHSVREFCECAFGYLGLDYKSYVREDIFAYRPHEPAKLVGNADKARTVLGWSPTVRFREIVQMMVDADLKLLTNT